MCGARDREADPAADRRPGAGDGGGHPVPGARARWCAPARASSSTCSPPAGAGLLARPGRRHGPPAHRPAEAEEAGEARHRGRGRPARREGRGQAAAHRLGGDGAAAGRRPGRARLRRPARRRTSTGSAASPSAWPAPTATRSTLDDLEPRTFSFNSPYGACPDCTGLGIKKEVDPELVVPDPELSLAEGAIAPWAVGHTAGVLRPAAGGPGQGRWASAWTPRGGELPSEAQKAVLHGSDDQVHVRYRNRYGRERSYYANYEGVIPFLERRSTRPSPSRSGALRGLHARRAVPGLQGRAAQAGGPRGHPRTASGRRSIAEVSAMSVAECSEFLDGMELDERAGDDRRAGAQGGAGAAGLPARRRAATTCRCPRAAGTLSGGEAQRIRLATQIGSGLVGVLYVLDEPSIGLHQRDNRRLIETLVRLRDLGNTLIVVEHDEDTIRAADWVVDIGPGAGEHGGHDRAQRHRSRAADATRSRSPAPTCPGGDRSRCPPSAARSTGSGS